MIPQPSISNITYTLNIPYPPQENLLEHEFSFTPPSPFSLNDLLSGSIKSMNGVFYYGSFDTPYERIPSTLATVCIEELTTAVYLDEFADTSFATLRYLSYPRAGPNQNTSNHFYLAHEIRQQPDFDHIVHGTIDNCSGTGNINLIYTAGKLALW